jgi:hypothetical protein
MPASVYPKGDIFYMEDGREEKKTKWHVHRSNQKCSARALQRYQKRALLVLLVSYKLGSCIQGVVDANGGLACQDRVVLAFSYYSGFRALSTTTIPWTALPDHKVEPTHVSIHRTATSSGASASLAILVRANINLSRSRAPRHGSGAPWLPRACPTPTLRPPPRATCR